MALPANPNQKQKKQRKSSNSSTKDAVAHTKKRIETKKPNSQAPMLASDFDAEGSLLKGLDLDIGSFEEVTISEVAAEVIGEDEKAKPILSFKEIDKRLVLNKTNRGVLQEAFGNDMRRWAGHRIVLFPAMVDFRGKSVQAVRLRLPGPKKASGGGLRRKG